jgi:hypothetical protein
MKRYEDRERDTRQGRCLHAAILACAFALIPVRAAAFGDFSLELRPRWNHIEESDKPLTTEGGTVRVIAGWRSPPLYGFRFTVEGIHTDQFSKRFNDTFSPTSPYPLLPDPKTTDFNQVHVEYAGLADTRIRVGRQLVRMDNQRWVSDNDFRQIPQLFEGVSVLNTSLANTRLYAARFDRVRTTSGNDNALELSLLHAAFNPLPGHGVAAYGYFHDQPQNGAFTGFANNSYRVVGARAEGSFPAGPVEIPYLVEAARQDAYAGGDSRIDARYWRVGAGVTWRELVARYDEELKGSNGGRYGVQMPLTDFYAFNGWTLHFFNTPRQGLRDRWVTLRHAIGPVTLYGEHHRFRSDFGGLDFGRETDVGVSWSVTGGATLRLQHARYDPGGGGIGARVRKTWLTLTWTL